MATIQAQEQSPSLISSWLKRLRQRRQRLRARKLSQVRFGLTREGYHLLFIVVFIFVGAVLRDISLLILIAASMIGLLILQWRFNISTIRRLTAKRRIPNRINQGVSILCQLTIENSKRWLGAWLVVAEDSIQLVSPSAARTVFNAQAVVDEVAAGSSSSCVYKLQFQQRGLYRVGPCKLSTRFPMGLGQGWRTIDTIDEVVVHPRQGQLLPAVKGLLHNSKDGNHRSTSHVGAHEADFYGLRPWTSGDSRRWIHWRTTARLGELSVRQFDRLEQQQACVLLDLHSHTSTQDEKQGQVCEKAISFVTTLISQAALAQRNKLAVAIAGDTAFTVVGVQSALLANSLLDRLAVVSPSSRPDVAGALGKMTAALLANPHLRGVSTRPQEIETLQQTIVSLLGKKASSRLHIQWLDVQRGDLEPYFSWTSNESND